VLGPFHVGNDVKIGSGSVVLKEIPDGCTVVGVPGRVVKRFGESTSDINQINLPDPVNTEMEVLRRRLELMEEKVEKLTRELEKREEEESKEVELNEDEELLDAQDPEKYLRGVDTMFRNYPEIKLTPNQEKRCRNGNSFSVNLAEGTYRAYSQSGEFLMLAKVEDGVMSTIKSFFEVE
jgi:hypothetical protein